MCCLPRKATTNCQKVGDLKLKKFIFSQSGSQRSFASGSVIKNPPVIQETPARSLGQVDPLEEGMVTHSSILDWRIPWMEKTSGLWSYRVTKRWT